MKNQGLPHAPSPDCRGNALIFVLIVIALLGALTATLSRTSQQQNNLSGEETALLAQQLIRNMGNYASAVSTVINSNNCSENEITFEYSGGDSNYTNSQAPTSKRCHIFNAAGGGADPATLPLNNSLKETSQSAQSKYGMIHFSGDHCLLTAGGEDTTVCKTELFAVANYVTQDVCKAVNQLAGISNYSSDLNEDVSPDTFDGNFDPDFTITGAGDDVLGNAAGTSEIKNKSFFCLHKNGGTPRYFVFYVLMAR